MCIKKRVSIFYVEINIKTRCSKLIFIKGEKGVFLLCFFLVNVGKEVFLVDCAERNNSRVLDSCLINKLIGRCVKRAIVMQIWFCARFF